MAFRPVEGVLSEIGDGRAMLAALSGQEVIVLNDTGTMVWGLLAEHGDPAELARLVHEAYPEIAYADVERDVRTFLDELAAAELIEQM